MSKSLVIAEKPSVGKDIARVINCKKGNNGFFEGDKYVVTWALGHLVTLADPERYDKKYKTWELNDLPIIPEKLKIETIPKTSKQFNTIKSLMLRPDITEIIIATDAGREGELVARWIIEKVGVKKKIKRLWISSVTDKAIKDGFSNLKDGKEYENLYKSAVARAEADWLIGINATRALTTKNNAQLSCGRVQTPTLSIIKFREDEINTFVPQKFYKIIAKNKNIQFTWLHDNNNSTTFDKNKIDQVLPKISSGSLKVTNIKKTDKKTFPPKLYDLTELQKDANSLYNYSAKETLNIMQKLYETHKVLTYPRTDSRYLSKDIVQTIPSRLLPLKRTHFKESVTKILNSKIVANSNFVDDKKVSDHHAIIPTEQVFEISMLSEKERKIYDLVTRRFLSVLYPAMEYEETIITGKIGTEVFTTKGKFIKTLGFKELTNTHTTEDDDDGYVLPKILVGQTFEDLKIVVEESFTKPPSLFTEGTLLKAMENPAIYTKNKDLKKTLTETGGLGTVATRADILDKLYNSFLIESRNNKIVITSKGKQLLNLAPSDLSSPDLTGEWEAKLKDISTGKVKKDTFMNEIKIYTKEIVTEIKQSEQTFKHTNVTGTLCPECGKPMLDINGKKGKMLVCQDRECGHRKSVSIVTNARCPKCKKKLELVGDGEKRKFVCKCGYREGYAKFEERRSSEKSNISKKDVEKFLKNQDKKNETPNAFAQAFQNLNLK